MGLDLRRNPLVVEPEFLFAFSTPSTRRWVWFRPNFCEKTKALGQQLNVGAPGSDFLDSQRLMDFSGSRSFVLVFLCRKQFINQPDSLASNSMEKESSHSGNLTQLLNMAH